MFLFMVAGSVQHELCVTPRRLLSHTVSVAELELGQEGAAAPATTVSKTASSTFLFLLFFHVHSSRTHWHRGWTTQSVSLKKNAFPISAFFFTHMWRKGAKKSPHTARCKISVSYKKFHVVFFIFVASRSPVLKPFFFLHPKSQLKVSMNKRIKGRFIKKLF